MGRFRTRLLSGIAFGAFALCVALFAWLSGNSSVFPPELWDEVSVAAGIRPPQLPMPGFWRFGVSKLIDVAGLDRTLFMLRALGPVALGLLAVFMYIFLGEVLPQALRMRMNKWGWSRRIVHVLLMQGALCFVLSSPVWKAGRALSPDMLLLLAGMVMLLVFCLALRRGRPFLAMFMSALAGVFAAETVFAFVLPFAFAAFVRRRLSEPGVVMDESLSNPLLRYLTFRRMSVLFFLSWVLGVYLNSQYFWSHGGLDVQGWSKFTYFFHYFNGYVLEIGTAAHPLGWVFVVVAVVAPLVISVRLVGVATDDDKFLSYLVGLFFFVMGVFAFIQSTGWSSAWFWCWGESPEKVHSQFLLCVCIFMTSVTVTLSLCVVCVEFYFRNANRIAQTHFEDNAEEASNWSRVVQSFRRAGRAARTVLAYEPLIAFVLLLLPKFSSLERDMASVVNDCAWQAAAECGSAGLMFTDGLMDAAVEVAAMRQGRKLKALSMVAGSSPYEQYIRTRGETDEEDREMLKSGAANTLRTWVRDKQERAADIAVQVGLELWLRNGLKAPEFGGLVARTAGFPEGERDKWIEGARRLAERALSLHEEGDIGKVTNARLVDQFSSVEWRIARMCQMRADADDRSGRADSTMAETELAEKLDDCNVTWGRVRDRIEWVEMAYDERQTPREGLMNCLKRGDFGQARVYARRLLHANPNDSRANFAMGMSYFVEEKYNRAEAYLKRSLIERPDEPAALNNLAIVQIRLGKYAEAETNAVRAVKNLPDSKEANGTLRYVREQLSKKETS